MQARNLLLVMATALVASACNKVDFQHIQGASCQGFSKACITKNGIDYFDYTQRSKDVNNKTDILFVDDNSGSMAPDQDQMAYRFPTFLGSLTNLDWRIGIITTDVSGTSATQDGQLLQFDSLPDFFITKAMADVSFNNVNNSFANTIRRTELGSGDERGIYAAIRALDRRAQRSFIRDDANLAIVILSDEDERSTGGSSSGPQGGPLESGRDNPQDLINYVNSTWSLEKNLTVHSIIIKPGDTSCQAQQQAQSNGTGNMGTTYAALTRLTGGIQGTICASDYGSQLAAMGQVIQQTTASMTLACVPVAGSLQITPATGWTQNADKILFNPPLNPGTEVRFIYQCPSRS